VLKKTIVTLAMCTALAGGVGSAGVAAAAAPKTPAVTATAHSNPHHLRRWLAAHRVQIRRAVVTISAKTMGISRQDLVTQLRSGKSIAGVASAHGVSTQTVVDALMGAVDAKVTKAVTNHKFASAQASKIETKLRGVVVKLVNHSFGQKISVPTPAAA